MKNQIFITSFLLLVSITIYAQKDTINTAMLNTNEQIISKDVARNNFLQSYIDSLNLYESGELPFFLSQVDFDYKNAGYWSNLNSPVSMRKIIFDNIVNENVLQVIINSKNKVYRQTFYFENKGFINIQIPFIMFSNYQLALLRYEELKQEKNK